MQRPGGLLYARQAVSVSRRSRSDPIRVAPSSSLVALPHRSKPGSRSAALWGSRPRLTRSRYLLFLAIASRYRCSASSNLSCRFAACSWASRRTESGFVDSTLGA